MAEPVLGKDVLIFFQQGDALVLYTCATDISIEFNMETKSTKTIGHGVWKRSRGQSLGYRVNIDGVIFLEQSAPVAFDLLSYFTNMTDIQFIIRFIDVEGKLRVIEGYALPTNVNLGGGSEGHATGSFTLEGNGGVDIREEMLGCQAEITDTHLSIVGGPVRRRVHIDSMSAESPTITRFDYRVNGGGIRSAFTDGNIPTYWDLEFNDGVLGAILIEITPICENGVSGEVFTIDIGP